MKLRYIIRFFLVVSFFINLFTHARFDQVIFDQAAELYGNKTANLMELQKIVEELNKQTPGRYAVPAFLGISHPETRAHLKTAKHPDEQSVADYIDGQWKEFKKTQPQGSTTLAAGVKLILKNIRDAILQAFDPATYPFIIQNPARKATFDRFINTVASAKKLLMVRSTGREDSKKLANAGGNESVSSVPPEIKTITPAVGEVVESYYSEKSLGQRLLAKDKTIFDREPFLPVLQQIMIGEQVGGAPNVSGIPVSGVMFSQEAEGRTPGVTHIQATWGHNEGVVNGLVPVDSFYVGQSNLIHPIVRIKQHRLVTMRKNGKNVLERKANPRAAQRVQCLTPQDVIDLKKGADAIVNHYNQGPYDIEFVLLNGVINWVQARPITHKNIQPSYLKDEFINQLKDKQNIYTFGAGGGKTHIIDSESAIIITDNIRDALTNFLKREDKEQIKAIIVGEMAPATSHEATTFRSEGLPVLYAANVGTVKGWAKQANNQPLLIDPQRELIALFSASEQLKTPRDAIKDGWFAHPISKKVSVLAEFYIDLPRIEVAQEHYTGVKTSELINMIKNSTDATEVTNALQSVLHRVAFAIKKQKDEKTINPQLIRNAIEVFTYLGHSAFEVQQAFDIWSTSSKTNEDKIKRLYPIVFFETLIKQLPAPREFVNDFSVSSLLKIELMEKAIVGQLALTETKWKEYLVQYAKATEYALTGELKQRWNRFVKGLETIPDKQQVPFVRTIFTVATLELMPLWLNVSFAQKTGDTQTVVQALLAEFNASQDFLKKLQEKAQQLNEINMANWGEPDKFLKQWEQFKTDILSYFISDEFLKDFESAPPLGKNGAAAVMHKLVDTFDLSIKALKASKQKYSNIGTLIERFKSMLDDYFAVLKKWVKITGISHDIVALLDRQTFKTVDQYLEEINKLKEKTLTGASTLEPSPGFNVDAAALGSEALWSRSIGDQPTLEDIFTLIHQNLLVMLGVTVKNSSIQEITLPPLVESLRENIEKEMSVVPDQKASLIGVKLNGNELTLFYNKPLRNHSETFQIIYDMKNKLTIFAVQFVGIAKQRWDDVAIVASILSEEKNLSFFKKPEADRERGIVEISWKVLNKDQVHLIMYLKKVFEKISLDGQVLKVISDKEKSYFIEQIKNNPNLTLEFPELMAEEYITFDEATEAASLGIESTDERAKQKALELFTKLVKKKQAFDKAIVAAEIGIASSDETTKQNALYLFEMLVANGKAFDNAIKAAEIGVASSDETTKQNSLYLFEMLVRKGQAFTKAIKTAEIAIKSAIRETKNVALKLFSTLVEKGESKAFDLAIEAAKIGIEGDHFSTRNNALSLFEELFKRKKAFAEATGAANRGIKSADAYEKIDALRLFKALVENGQAYYEATEASKIGMLDKRESVQSASNNLRRVLNKYRKSKVE